MPQDDTCGWMWLDIALSGGNETARQSLDSIASRMPPAQLETARQLARECVEKNYTGC